MIKIETNIKNLFRFDNVISHSNCERITDYLKVVFTDDEKDLNKMPWHNNDSLDFKTIKNSDLLFFIKKLRFEIALLASECYNSILYPNFTDLVLWRKGMKMAEHKDTPYGNPGDNFYRAELIERYVSCVIYLNDDYIGGETIITNLKGERYISVPKTGSVIFFFSDDRHIHSVNEIKEGKRYTLPIWFTKNPRALEELLC